MPSSVLSDYIYCVFGWPLLKYASVAITCIAYNQYNDDKKKSHCGCIFYTFIKWNVEWMYFLDTYITPFSPLFLGCIYIPPFSPRLGSFCHTVISEFFLVYFDEKTLVFFLLLVCLHVVIDENRIWSLWPNNWFCWLIYWMATVLHIKAVADV